MLLTENEIKSFNLIKDGAEKNYRGISYDIRVKEIIGPDGTRSDSYSLKPQGIVEVVSNEEITLPDNIAGYAMVRTGLCDQGILPLNIGIIDPGYKGYISTTLLNFGKNDFMLTSGEVFLRLTFHECKKSVSKEKLGWEVPHEEYITTKIKKTSKFAETFLNLEKYTKEASKEFLNSGLKYVVVGAIIITLSAFLVTLGVNWGNRPFWSREELKSELLKELENKKSNSENKTQEQLEKEIQDLKVEIEVLKKIQK